MNQYDCRKELKTRKILQFDGSRFVAAEISLIREVLLQILCNQHLIVVTACAGHHLDELAVGFLRSEGYIEVRKDIESLQVATDPYLVHVTTRSAEGDDHEKQKEGSLLFASGGRGRDRSPPPENLGKINMLLSPQNILLWMEELVNRSILHNISHGTHCSALADERGIIISREDIGRHNTIDMIGGRMLFDDWDGADKILLTTGRISSEMVQKVWTLGIPVIITRSAPTSEALRLLEEAGITLIGYVRNSQMNVYTHERRVMV